MPSVTAPIGRIRATVKAPVIPSTHLQDLLHTYGYAAIFGVIALENVGLPIPGETILLTAAIYAGETRGLNIVAIVTSATAAAFVGSMAGFHIGQYGERHVLRRYGRYLHLN